jgi:predicted DNA-binding protein (UPF0251 family)
VHNISFPKAASVILEMVNPEALSAELELINIPDVEDLEQRATLALRGCQVRSQSDAAAFLVNATNGTITSEQLTRFLSESFPTARIGKRHGPHYLCLCRTGKIAIRDGITVPKAKRKSKTKVVVEVEPEVASEEVVEAVAAEVNRAEEIAAMDYKALKELAKKLGVSQKGKADALRARVLAA